MPSDTPGDSGAWQGASCRLPLRTPRPQRFRRPLRSFSSAGMEVAHAPERMWPRPSAGGPRDVRPARGTTGS